MSKNYTLTGVSDTLELGPSGPTFVANGNEVLLNGETVVVSNSSNPVFLKLSAVFNTISGGNNTYLIGTVPENSIIISCSVNVTSAFLGSPLLTIGNTDIDGVHKTTDSNLLETGLNHNRVFCKVLTDTEINAIITGASGSGTIDVLLEFYLS